MENTVQKIYSTEELKQVILENFDEKVLDFLFLEVSLSSEIDTKITQKENGTITRKLNLMKKGDEIWIRNFDGKDITSLHLKLVFDKNIKCLL